MARSKIKDGVRRAVAFCVCVLIPVMAAATDSVTPGAVRIDSTFEHLGIVWWIADDDNRDSELEIEFRKQGSGFWFEGAPSVRAYPGLVVNGSALGLDYHGASAMFLEPGADYELRLTLSDPDGGGEVRLVSAITRRALPLGFGGAKRYVVPGNGGGDGTVGNPFQGLQAAADAAVPGDRFAVAGGSYVPFQILTSGTPSQPIVFSGPGDGTAVVDGAATDRGLVTMGEFNQTISDVVIEGLTLQNGRWGVDAQHSRDIVIRFNTIQNVDDGVVNRRGDALERNQTVCDNTIVGRVAWPGVGIPSERGIDLKGHGNVVCHNSVRNFGDCVSVQPSTGGSYGNDVFGNDASYCVDDGIEVDYNQANARVWRNRVMNARMGVSVQPTRGGPTYIFRNELFNLQSVPIKMHNHTTGFFVVHNTGAKHGDGHGDNGAMWRYATFRNNLFLGTRYAFEFTTQPDEGWRDFDYNAWGTTREIGGSGAPWFKWDNVRYDDLADLQSIGVELNGVDAAFSDLINAVLPGDWDQPAAPGSRDLRLNPGVAAIDSGLDLPNLNDAFVLIGSPDMGAFEQGQALPHYGPRPWFWPLFSDGFESGGDSAWSSVLP